MSETTPIRGPKVIILDIETAPATALVFGQFKQNISNIQVIKRDRILGIGAKWSGSDTVMWRSEYHHGRDVMMTWIRDLLNEADCVVHFNGTSFDMPWIRREIAELGLDPYSPVAEIDVLRAVRKQFRYMSNKLEAVVQVFGAGVKMENGGFKLWRDIEVGDEDQQRKAWALMRRYCKRDVAITDDLYLRIRPYIPNHPHVGLYTDDLTVDCCDACGSTELRLEGFAYTKVGKYQRYQCRGCGKWGKFKKSLGFVDARGVAS